MGHLEEMLLVMKVLYHPLWKPGEPVKGVDIGVPALL